MERLVVKHLVFIALGLTFVANAPIDNSALPSTAGASAQEPVQEPAERSAQRYFTPDPSSTTIPTGYSFPLTQPLVRAYKDYGRRCHFQVGLCAYSHTCLFAHHILDDEKLMCTTINTIAERCNVSPEYAQFAIARYLELLTTDPRAGSSDAALSTYRASGEASTEHHPWMCAEFQYRVQQEIERQSTLGQTVEPQVNILTQELHKLTESRRRLKILLDQIIGFKTGKFPVTALALIYSYLNIEPELDIHRLSTKIFSTLLEITAEEDKKRRKEKRRAIMERRKKEQ